MMSMLQSGAKVLIIFIEIICAGGTIKKETLDPRGAARLSRKRAPESRQLVFLGVRMCTVYHWKLDVLRGEWVNG